MRTGAERAAPPGGARGRAPLIAFAAVAGVVAGHALAYAAAYPNAGVREVLLGQTGHRYWSTAIACAVVFGAIAVFGTVGRHFIRGVRGVGAEGEQPAGWWEGVRRSALRLAALQVSLFVIQEVVERLLAHAPVSSMLHGPFLSIGLALQVLVAAALALVLSFLGRAAEAIGRALAPAEPVRRATPRYGVAAGRTFASAILLGTRLTRGPPAPSLA
jgi:hypothetical protein